MMALSRECEVGRQHGCRPLASEWFINSLQQGLKHGRVWPLTPGGVYVTMFLRGVSLAAGGMSEWFMVAVLKTAVRKHRGFESLSLRRNHAIRLGEVA